MENNSIAILGGSFDPPGIHHMMMVSELLNLREVERVIIVPCGIREDKKLTASGSQRLEMLRLSVEEVLDNDPRVSIDDIEIKNGKTIPTVYLMDKLKSKPEFSGKSLKVVIGADLVPWLSLWDEGERLKSDNEFIVFSRGNRVIDPQDMPPKSRTVKETFITDLSSTLLRERIKLAKDRYPEDTTLGLLGLIPKSVRKYISEHNLYV